MIFVLNHPNGLIDPVFLLCLAPRRVSYVAKATLFTMPVVGALVRAFDSLPVQRQQDRATGVDNRETFRRARDLLSGGGSLGIFPEGVSHNHPRLRELRTGAARIALGTGLADLQIVPVGLTYSDKAIFRSQAWVVFGAPLAVSPVALGENGEPPAAAVRDLTDRIAAALAEVTLQADAQEILGQVDRVARILRAAGEPAAAASDPVALRRRLVAGYEALSALIPDEVTALVGRLDAYEAEVRALGVAIDHPPPRVLGGARLLGVGLLSLVIVVVLAPLAGLGTLIHYPAYRGIGGLARRFSGGEDDLVATIKILGALLFFPLTWIAVALALGFGGGGLVGGALALGLVPLSGVVALHFWEGIDRLRAGFRLAWLGLRRRSVVAAMAEERRALAAAIAELLEQTEVQAGRHSDRSDRR